MANSPGRWHWKKSDNSLSCVLCVSWSPDLLILGITGGFCAQKTRFRDTNRCWETRFRKPLK
jgi:hypothetical protein